VYEWEDILSSDLNIPITNINKKSTFYGRINKYHLALFIQLFDKIFNSKKKSHLYFEMAASLNYSISSRINVIPVIIDFYLKEEDLPTFYKLHRNNICILVSSMEVYTFLVQHKCPIRLYHFPLSIADTYALKKDNKFAKKYDIVLPGRQNNILLSFFEKYKLKYPDLHYVYCKLVDGKFIYVSNKDGVLGDFRSRAEYMKLLQLSRISLYATPGMDEGSTRTNGFDQVTPRFLELISSGCFVAGRYSKNPDTDYFELNKFCSSIDSYEVFENSVNNYLKAVEIDYSIHYAYMQNHYTSQRSKLLNDILNRQL